MAPSQLVTIDINESAHHAFECLCTKNILSAPVFDPTSHGFVGLVDILDLVAVVVEAFDATNKAGGVESPAAVSALEKHFASLTVRDIMGRSHANRFCPIPYDSSLATALESLIQEGVRRVVLTSPDGTLLNILTQSAVIKFLAARTDNLGDLGACTVEELKMGVRDVVTVDEGQSALDAFRIMYRAKVTGLPILDENKKAFGTISAKDLKGIERNEQLYSTLYFPVTGFINRIRQENLRATYPVMNCKESDNMKKVIGKLAAAGVHRLWILGDGHELKGVVSLRDCLQALVMH
eukprot:TRINITY_DN29265_c0_g1_i2.p1 TRINITY_DN29265_c0_g1~~TRINITY_DN29265_c0_g1_i2.p1  ORF type:complete len:320 (+),score=70.25 TRINITY_DN29265_c0_g1_i2:80-961(+)